MLGIRVRRGGRSPVVQEAKFPAGGNFTTPTIPPDPPSTNLICLFSSRGREELLGHAAPGTKPLLTQPSVGSSEDTLAYVSPQQHVAARYTHNRAHTQFTARHCKHIAGEGQAVSTRRDYPGGSPPSERPSGGSAKHRPQTSTLNTLVWVAWVGEDEQRVGRGLSQNGIL